MNDTDHKRRIILKGALAAGAVGAAMSAGLAYTHRAINPAWPKAAFNAGTLDEALRQLTGGHEVTPAPDEIRIKAPAVAENGLAHVTIQSRLPGSESITLFIPNNAAPLVAHFRFGPQVAGAITTRIKMERSGELVAVVRANGRLYSARRKIRPAGALPG